MLRLMQNLRGVHLPKFIFCFTLLFFPFTYRVFSQDMVSLYEKFIPDEILKNDNYRQMVNANLQAKAAIHPDLIYYNIEKLRMQYSEKGVESFNAYKLYVVKVENYYIAKRSKWADGEVKAFQKTENVNELKREFEGLYKPILRDTNSVNPAISQNYKIDNNLLDYFAVLYLSSKSIAEYDVKIDYRKIRVTIEEEKLENFTKYLSGKGEYSNFSLSDLNDKINHYWYLFDSSREKVSLNNMSISTRVYHKVLTSAYSSEEKPLFLIEVGYNFNNSLLKISNQYPVSYTFWTSAVQQDKSEFIPNEEFNPDIPQLVASLSYKFNLRKQMGFFSYLNVALSGSFMLNKQIIENTYSTTNKYIVQSADITDKMDLSVNRLNINSLNSFSIKTGLPIFVLGNFLTVELSANAGLIHVSSTVDYDYKMTRIEGYYIAFTNRYYSHKIAEGTGAGTIDINKNYFVFYPTLDLEYSTNFGVKIRGSISNNYLSFTTGFAF